MMELLVFPSIEQVISDNTTTSQTIAESWDTVWEAFFNFTNASSFASGEFLFSLVSDLGVVMAAGSIAVLTLVLARESMFQRDYPQYFLNILIPSFVALFLANGGKLTAQWCYAMRGVINDLNHYILRSIVVGVDLQESFNQLVDSSLARLVYAQGIQQCEVLIGQEQLDCLQFVNVSMRLTISNLEASAGTSNPGFFAAMRDFLSLKPDEAIGSLVMPLMESFVASVMADFMLAYQNLLELSLFVTAIIAPLAVGASMLPLQPRPIITWTVGFFSVGFAKICFNLACGLAAVTSANHSQVIISNLEESTHLFVYFGLFAPVFASILAGLGGMAAWQGISNLTGRVAAFAFETLKMGFFRGR